MSPENVCPRFKQNAWKKELCSNCFRPKEEHPEKPKRVYVDYKPLPEVSAAQSILKVNGSCDKSRNVSFANVEFEVIGYGGEEYSTDEEYSSDDEDRTEYVDSGDDEDLKRLTEANTNINGKLIVPEKLQAKTVLPTSKTSEVSPNNKTFAKPAQVKSSSPPLVTVQPFGGEPPKSLVFNFLKNKEIAAATASAAATVAALQQVPKEVEKVEKKNVEDVQLRKTETTKKTTLSRSSLVANSNEPYLNIKRCSLPADEDSGNKLGQSSTTVTPLEIPKVKLHPPETVIACVEKPALHQDNDSFYTNNNSKESDVDTAGGGGSLSSYKTRSNVPRMGTMHFKLKLAGTAQKPETAKPFAAASVDQTPPSQAPPTPPPPPPPAPPSSDPSSLTSREMAGEPDGKADSDEPGDPTTTPVNRSFLHSFKDGLTSLQHDPIVTTPLRTPVKKVSISSNGSPPGAECPRSIKRQAPKPPPPPPSANNRSLSSSELVYHSAASSFSDDGDDDDDDDDDFRPDDVTMANRKLLAEYCEQIEKEQQSIQCNSVAVDHCKERSLTTPTAMVVTGGGAGGESTTRESSTLPTPSKRPVYEKKKYGKASRVGLKIKKFLRIPSRESVATPSPQPSLRPKLEIIHPLDINKSGVEIIHNAADGFYAKELASKGVINHYPVRPTKPPPPPRSLPPVVKLPTSPARPAAVRPPEVGDHLDGSKTCNSNGSGDDNYEPVNFSAPECDHHGSPEMARLTSMQYCGSETESETYPTIRFGDDFGAEDSIRNTRPGHNKSLEESYDAVVIANHEALTKLLDQATCGPKVPKELVALKTNSLQWSSFYVDPTSRLLKAGCAFYNGKWYDVPVVLSVSGQQVKLNDVLNNHFTLTKVAQFVDRVETEFSPGAETGEAYVTLWNAHRVEAIESYCKEYNAKYADVTKEAGLILVETVNLLMGLQASDVRRYSLEPLVVTRNRFGADPTVAVVQLETDFEANGCSLPEVMLKVLRLLAPTWEMTVCLSQVLRQGKPNSLSKCKALLEFWLWGPTGVTAVAADRPLSLKRWLDLERANNLHGHVCSRSVVLSVEEICFMLFLVANDEKMLTDAWTVLIDQNMRPPSDPVISKC
ncbi:Hypothetical protein CINCED_3A024933 [Cinara cedri]|uniref:Uncharacterized protein n=2 Tax=Cinara cedri TaxID=506608 RepID=A0A5E4MV37_9HEMI|nr:Hypothetical protein CINCED_3A024933 [Cinara cedri]